MESSSSSSRRRNRALPLIPCPFCDAKIITAVCGPHGSKPGHRYYKCSKKDTGKCRFYEWEEGYEVYLQDQNDAQWPGQARGPDATFFGAAANQAIPGGPQAFNDLARVNTLLGAANIIATLLVLFFAMAFFIVFISSR